jgi:hypothetical protein
LKLNGTHQLLVYTDDVNVLGKIVHTVKENAEALIVASKEIGLEVQGVRKKIVPFSKTFLWAPDVILESFIYKQLGNKSKFFFVPTGTAGISIKSRSI